MKGKLFKVILVWIGLLGSFLSAAVGYWLAAAIGFMKQESLPFDRAINKVFLDPFAPYVNEYTSVIILMAFILFQTIFFLYLLLVRKGTSKKRQFEEREEEDSVNSDTADYLVGSVISDDKKTAEISNDEPEEQDAMGFVLPEEVLSERSEEPATEIVEFETVESENQEEELFSSEVVLELLSLQYGMDQILEMKKITKYIDNLKLSVLKRMFKPTMPADDIREYIEMFYGS